MQAFVTYTAKRSLAPGHRAERTYTIPFDIADALPSVSDVKTRERSQGGGRYAALHRQDRLWRIEFAPVCGTELLLLREFLDSTESGQTFRMELYGDEVESMALRRLEDSHSEQPFMRVGSSEGDWFRAGIEAVESGDESDTIDIYNPEVGGPIGGLGPSILLTEGGDRIATQGGDVLQVED
jgi:hypothetical protein